MERYDMRVCARVPIFRWIAVALLKKVIEVHPVDGSVCLPLEALIAPKIFSPIAIATAQIKEVVVAGLKQAPKSKNRILRENLERTVHPVLAVVEVNLEGVKKERTSNLFKKPTLH